jgi:nucleoid-associated protein YgaU
MIRKFIPIIVAFILLIANIYYFYQRNNYQKKLLNDTSSVNTVREETKSEVTESKKLYVIKSGDTLWDIAEKEYGSGFKYNEIIKKNPGKTFKFKNGAEGLIFPGTQLEL